MPYKSNKIKLETKPKKTKKSKRKTKSFNRAYKKAINLRNNYTAPRR